MYYGPTIENIKLIPEKAKTKTDGVFTARGVIYKVKKNRMTHYAYCGEIFEMCGHFVVISGTYTTKSEARKLLKGI